MPGEEVRSDNVRRFKGGNLFMSAGLLKSVPLGEILAALSTHEIEMERQPCFDDGKFTTAHQAPNRIDFQVISDCSTGLTSLCLHDEPPGL